MPMTALLTTEEALREELQAARLELEQARREFALFRERVNELGNEAAEEHDFCGVYDELMQRLGLPGRERSWSVSADVMFRATVSVKARTYDEAKEIVKNADRPDELDLFPACDEIDDAATTWRWRITI
jgi:hypothetical protein